jgi:hypothetical protein
MTASDIIQAYKDPDSLENSALGTPPNPIGTLAAPSLGPPAWARS